MARPSGAGDLSVCGYGNFLLHLLWFVAGACGSGSLRTVRKQKCQTKKGNAPGAGHSGRRYGVSMVSDVRSLATDALSPNSDNHYYDRVEFATVQNMR